MDSTNKVLALFVGLFVVILLIGVGLSRVAKDKKSLNGSLGSIFKSKATPTPTKKPKVITIATPVANAPIVVQNTSSQQPSSTTIPETGATTMPLILSSLAAGIYLLKKKV